MKIYSKITGELLHQIVNLIEEKEKRTDYSPATSYLQVAGLRLRTGNTFIPHKHHEHLKVTTRTQESWFVYNGVILATFYDLDDTVLTKVELTAGMLSITYKGGHNYECLAPALVVEYKTGPYYGQEFDKTMI